MSDELVIFLILDGRRELLELCLMNLPAVSKW